MGKIMDRCTSCGEPFTEVHEEDLCDTCRDAIAADRYRLQLLSYIAILQSVKERTISWYPTFREIEEPFTPQELEAFDVAIEVLSDKVKEL